MSPLVPPPRSHIPEAQSGSAYTVPAVTSSVSVARRTPDVRKITAKMLKASACFEKLRPTFSAPPLCSLLFEPRTLSKAIYPITVGVGVGMGVSVGVGVLVGVEVGVGGTMSKTASNS